MSLCWVYTGEIICNIQIDIAISTINIKGV